MYRSEASSQVVKVSQDLCSVIEFSELKCHNNV